MPHVSPPRRNLHGTARHLSSLALNFLLMGLMAFGPACETYRGTGRWSASPLGLQPTQRVVFRPTVAPVEVTQAQFTEAMRWLVPLLPLPSPHAQGGPFGQVTLASFEAKPQGRPSLLRLSQAERCTGRRALACLSLMKDGYSLATGEDRVHTAMAIAFRGLLASTGGALVDMVSLDELVRLIAGAVITYLVVALIPEPFSKVLLAVVTAAVIAQLGWDTYWSIVKGYGTLKQEASDAVDFEGVEAAGQHFSQVLGPNAARVVVLLATVLLASGGGGGSGAKLAKLLKRLPGASQVGARMAAAGISTEALLEGTQSAVLSEEGLTLEMAASDAAEATTVAEASQADGARKAVAAGAGVVLATPPGDGPNRPEDDEKDGLDAATEERLAEEASFEELETALSEPSDRLPGGWRELEKVRFPNAAPKDVKEAEWQRYLKYFQKRLQELREQEVKPPSSPDDVKPSPLKLHAYLKLETWRNRGRVFEGFVGEGLVAESSLPQGQRTLLKGFAGKVEIFKQLGLSKGKHLKTRFVDFLIMAKNAATKNQLEAESVSVKSRDFTKKTAKEIIEIIKKDYRDGLKFYAGKPQIRRLGEFFGKRIKVTKLHLVYEKELAPKNDVLKEVVPELRNFKIEVSWYAKPRTTSH